MAAATPAAAVGAVAVVAAVAAATAVAVVAAVAAATAVAVVAAVAAATAVAVVAEMMDVAGAVDFCGSTVLGTPESVGMKGQTDWQAQQISHLVCSLAGQRCSEA